MNCVVLEAMLFLKKEKKKFKRLVNRTWLPEHQRPKRYEQDLECLLNRLRALHLSLLLSFFCFF